MKMRILIECDRNVTIGYSVNFSTQRRVKLIKLELKTFTAKLRFLHRPKRFCLCYLPVGTFGRLGKFWFPS